MFSIDYGGKLCMQIFNGRIAGVLQVHAPGKLALTCSTFSCLATALAAGMCGSSTGKTVLLGSRSSYL